MQDLTVYYNDKPIFKLNSSLIARQNLTQQDVEIIKRLHLERIINIESAKQLVGVDNLTLRMKAKLDTKLEFLLQDAWGFPKDINYHRFWRFPGCTCPKMDNADAYPTGYYIYDEECPIHGKGSK